MDGATADCWRRFFDELTAALQRHPGCAEELLAQVDRAVHGFLRDAMAKGPETRKRLEDTVAAYHRLWSSGRKDSPEMGQLLADLLAC
jgi:hypothetical protein